jgi:hypothetical protein
VRLIPPKGHRTKFTRRRFRVERMGTSSNSTKTNHLPTITQKYSLSVILNHNTLIIRVIIQFQSGFGGSERRTRGKTQSSRTGSAELIGTNCNCSVTVLTASDGEPTRKPPKQEPNFAPTTVLDGPKEPPSLSNNDAVRPWYCGACRIPSATRPTTAPKLDVRFAIGHQASYGVERYRQ